MTNHGGMNKKEVMQANEQIYDAVYFNGNRRIQTYGGINITKAGLELILLTKRDHVAITMMLFPDGELKAKMGDKYLSWDIADYTPFL